MLKSAKQGLNPLGVETHKPANYANRSSSKPMIVFSSSVFVPSAPFDSAAQISNILAELPIDAPEGHPSNFSLAASTALASSLQPPPLLIQSVFNIQQHGNQRICFFGMVGIDSDRSPSSSPPHKGHDGVACQRLGRVQDAAQGAILRGRKASGQEDAITDTDLLFKVFGQWGAEHDAFAYGERAASETARDEYLGSANATGPNLPSVWPKVDGRMHLVRERKPNSAPETAKLAAVEAPIEAVPSDEAPGDAFVVVEA
ncbi:hypothetical protein QBC35DRAFT_556136 [Podospora australis]|uniref:Uncharacterized protein n=1 Tax=Podospora australis TaxID=1536484 RepID=A0AAN6WNV5_9PEZI|nr:hypothetical protein QBC35DRAFT_556136 [Podospora australis]